MDFDLVLTGKVIGHDMHHRERLGRGPRRARGCRRGRHAAGRARAAGFRVRHDPAGRHRCAGALAVAEGIRRISSGRPARPRPAASPPSSTCPMTRATSSARPRAVERKVAAGERAGARRFRALWHHRPGGWAGTHRRAGRRPASPPSSSPPSAPTPSAFRASPRRCSPSASPPSRRPGWPPASTTRTTRWSAPPIAKVKAAGITD